MADVLKVGHAPWWFFKRIDNFGMRDPAGPYWKPDTNVQIPGLYPVVNLLPGVVTNIRQTSWGQTVVTVKLDSPINGLATHEYYEHMSSAAVSVGQHLGTGDPVGTNNPSGSVPLGYGLYSGDVYGSGSAWDVLQKDLAPGGAGLLNPTKIIDAAKNGSIGGITEFGLPIPGLSFNDSSSSSSGNPLDFSWLTNSPLWQWASNPARVAKMVAGIMLIGISLYLLGTSEPEKIISRAAGVVGVKS